MRLSPSVAILRTQSDDRLVELARDGSEAAFAAIVERYRRSMLRGCRRVLPESRAEDAVQQAFISAWRALERGDGVTDLHAWLMRIARNTALNALRVSGYDYDELRESLRGSEAPQGELERRDVVRQTLAGLAALPERQREALMRSALEGASHAEIAKALGLSEGATRQLVLRARATMRSAAGALTPGPLIGWAAWTGRGAPGGEFVQRIAELTAGGGGAGAGALLAKASIVTVVAGSVVVGPSVVHRAPERAKAESVPAKSSAPHAASQPAGFFAPASASSSGSAQHVSSGSGGKAPSSGGGKSAGGKDSSGSSSSGEDSGSSQQGSADSSGPGSGTSDESDNSGPGSGSSGSDSSGSDDGGSDDSGSSGSGSGSSGSGSGTSGSDSSGSGSSGSGSPGSGPGSDDKPGEPKDSSSSGKGGDGDGDVPTVPGPLDD